MSTSAGRLLLSYLRTRFPPGLFLPLAGLLLTAAGRFVSFRPVESTLDCCLVLALLLQFRLADDLADRDCDRRSHPDRVLVQAETLRPFHRLLAALVGGTFLVTWVLRSDDATLIVLTLDGAALIWYGLLSRLHVPRLVAIHVVLLKYPALVAVVSSRYFLPESLAFHLTLALVYLTLTVYEFLHDPEVSASPGARVLLALEGALLGISGTALVMSTDVGPSWLRWLVVLAGVAGLTCLLDRHLRGQLSRRWAYGVFIVAFVWLSTPLWEGWEWL